MSEETLLITGATGFIGQNLLSLIRREGLDQRYRIVCLASSPIEGWTTLLEQRDDGLIQTKREDFSGVGVSAVDYVIHLGAFIPKSGALANDVSGSLANIENIQRLLSAFPAPPKRFVFASTVDVYGSVAEAASEHHPAAPATLYGTSKLFGEQLLAAVLPAEGLQVLRIGHTYGPGEQAYRKFIPESIRRLLANQPPLMSTSGEEQRSFIHVEDCCRMVLAALHCEAGIGPVIVASSKPVSLNEVAKMLCEIAAEELGTRLTPDYTEQPASGRSMTFQVDKMERYLGIERVTLEAGLREEFRAFATLPR